jgi:hypothetical protein
MVSSKELQKARQIAKRNRTSVACARCKTAKSKCTDYRPCKRCVIAGVGCDKVKSAPRHALNNIIEEFGAHTLRVLSGPFNSHSTPQKTAHIDLRHGTSINADNAENDVSTKSRIFMLGNTCHQVGVSPSHGSFIGHSDSRYGETDIQSGPFTKVWPGLANQSMALNQQSELGLIQIHATQQHVGGPFSGNICSNHDDHINQAPSGLRGDGSVWTQFPPTHHPTPHVLLPAFRTSPCPMAFVPPTITPLLSASAWAVPLLPHPAPFHRLLPALPFSPP